MPEGVAVSQCSVRPRAVGSPGNPQGDACWGFQGQLEASGRGRAAVPSTSQPVEGGVLALGPTGACQAWDLAQPPGCHFPSEQFVLRLSLLH